MCQVLVFLRIRVPYTTCVFPSKIHIYIPQRRPRMFPLPSPLKIRLGMHFGEFESWSFLIGSTQTSRATVSIHFDAMTG